VSLELLVPLPVPLVVRLRLLLMGRDGVQVNVGLPDKEPSVYELDGEGLEDPLKLEVPVGANVGVRDREGERLVLIDLEVVVEQEMEGREWENELLGVELLEKVLVLVGMQV